MRKKGNAPSTENHSLFSNRFLTAGAVIFVIVAGVVVWTKSGSRKIPSQEEFFAQNPSLQPPASMLLDKPYERKKGERLPSDYRFDLKNAHPITFTREVSANQQKQSVFRNYFAGNVVLHPVQVDESGTKLIAVFKFSKVDSKVLNGPVSTLLGVRTSEKVNPKLSTAVNQRNAEIRYGLLVSIEPNGKITSVKAQPVPDKQWNEALTAAAYFQYDIVDHALRRVPPIASGYMVVHEKNDQGQVSALPYTVTENGKTRLYVVDAKTDSKKDAEKDDRFKNLNLQVLSTQAVNSRWSIPLNLPEEQKTQDQVKINIASQEAAQVDSQFKSTWAAPIPNRMDPSVMREFTVEIDFDRARRDRGMLANHQINQITGKKTRVSWADARRGLTLVDSDQMSESEKTRHFLGYGDALKRDPNAIATARRDALDAAPDSRQLSMILGALGYVGTPEAQEALVAVYARTDLSQVDRQKVLSELAVPTDVLTPATKAFLMSVSKDNSKPDFAQSALFALGSSIAKDGDPQTIGYLAAKWDSQGGILGSSKAQLEERKNILLAMGNSKSNVFINEVKQGLSSSDEEFRGNAVNALRFNQDEPSRELLMGALFNDSSSAVQSVAAQSLSYQPYDKKTKDAAFRCATQDERPAAQAACVRLLADNVVDPETKIFLQSKLANSSNPQTREIVQSALSVEPDREPAQNEE